MGEENKINITYETIFELLRREKNRDELQKLNENFYIDVKFYIEDKTRAMSSDQSLSDQEHEKVSKQIQNTKRMVTELFERREKKIIVMALNKVRTSSAIVDTASLLPQEKKFFHDAINLFSIYRNDLFDLITQDKKNGQTAHVIYEPSHKKEEMLAERREETRKEELQTPKKIETQKEEQKQKSQSHENTPSQTASQQITEPPKKTKNTKMIRILAQIPKFIGRELEVYGPFNPDDMANIPSEIADILIKKGRAEEIKI